MISAVAKSGSFAPYLKNTSQAVVSSLKTAVKPVAVSSSDKVVAPSPVQSTVDLSVGSPLNRGKVAVAYSLNGPLQVRSVHTDVKVPDFSFYRKPSTLDPTKKAEATEASRKTFSYTVTAGGFILSTYAAKNLVTTFVSSMSASADVLAMASIEVNLNEIPEGKSVTFKWRGKPLFIRHRTAKDISNEAAVDLGSLRDPQHDNERTKDPKWLIVIGVCTHLGCVPVANAGDFGGYYCPCHGSHYDASGRIRKGPAPLNLEVPPYEFKEDGLLVVG
ncbi:Cytochrome b-c1 complex subunit Rieske, mitochondrial [Frankliniella fusca]|uniref:Cytochrome b-c1 complex subunit Rieske, mitochondrial n=2 Tax=Arthropoda TaxID=6656 RepID=A0AAE1HJV1_9NEOP|nr:Cytochrome b-c1 complex subunit Rieske, mitochondrial [Frankliniella fusca]